MKIGLDISQIIYQGTGVGRFTNGLVNSIINYDKKNQWVFFFSSLRKNFDWSLEKNITNKGYRLIKWKIPPTLLSFFWNDLHKFKILNLKFKINPDWFITSDWTEPPLPVNKATIVHDLVFLRHPETVDKKISKTQRTRINWVKKESEIIFADSQTTKNDIMNLLKVDDKKIIVNYPGVDIKIPNQKEINKTFSKLKLTKPFILAVGKTEPRKNIPRLIEAFDKLSNHEIDLVIAGPTGWDVSINQSIDTKNKQVHLVGFVSDQELYSLYIKSLGVVFPSIWEGFGYPLVEAMSLGTPIICSKIPPFEEIVRENAIYFNPLSVKDITQSINKLIHDNHLRKKLIENGKIRAKEFSWEKYYNTLIKTLYDHRH